MEALGLLAVGCVIGILVVGVLFFLILSGGSKEKEFSHEESLSRYKPGLGWKRGGFPE